MRSVRSITLTSILLVALALACPAAAQETPSDVPLVRMRDGHGSDLLFRLDPRTLQAIGRPIRTFRNGAGLGFSPDGSTIAYSGGSRTRSGIQFVDLARWRSLGVARLRHHGGLSVGWVSQGRVVAISDGASGRTRLLWIDVRSKKVLARRAFSGWAGDALAVPGGLALPARPPRGLAPARIMLLDRSGGLRTIVLDGIQAGSDYDKPRGQVLTPAMTVDPESATLYVVAARGGLVAEVDLATGTVSYHSLGASASKGNVDVWWRIAAWAGDGRIAVTGDHWPLPRGRRSVGPVPLGIRMIDTRSWSIATLDPRPDSMDLAGDTVLATGTRWFDGARRSESTGLLAFDADGRRAFTRFRGQSVALLGSRGRLGYVWVRQARTAHVIDLDSGRTLNRIRTGRRVPFLLSPP
jgi:hypothetical protein